MVITNNPGMIASLYVITAIDCASNFVVARDWGVCTLSSNARVVSANTAIIAIHWGVLASCGLVARINCARIAIVTADCRVGALASCENTRIIGTHVVVIASDNLVGHARTIESGACVGSAQSTKTFGNRTINYYGSSTLGAIGDSGVLAKTRCLIASSSNARVAGATVLGSVGASNFRVASIVGARVTVIATNGSFSTSTSGSTHVVSAGIVVVARNGREHTTSGRTAGVIGALTVVVASLGSK